MLFRQPHLLSFHDFQFHIKVLLDLPISVKYRDARIQIFWVSPLSSVLILKISLIIAIAWTSSLNNHYSHFIFMNLLGLPFRAYLFRLTFSDVPESSPLIAIALTSSLNNYYLQFKFMNLLGLPFRAYLF